MFHKLSLVALSLAPLAFAACQDDTAPVDDTSLDVVFQTNAGHIHIWETQVTYTATVTTRETPARQVTNFDTVRVEYAPVGATTWSKLGDLPLSSTFYTGALYWPSAGTFNYRLVGHRAGESGVQVLAAPATTVAAVRQHFDVGTWRVEFEPVPGFNQASETPAVKFFVMQATADASGIRAPIPGLTGVTIACVDPNGSSEIHNVTENPAGSGAFSQTHTFVTNGWAKATINFTGPAGQPTTATGTFGIGSVD